MQKVFDVNHISVGLDKKFGSGGEADIFSLKAKPNILFKRYHQRVLDKRGQELSRKVEAMRHIAIFRNNPSLSWPKISLYNNRRQWVVHAIPVRTELNLIHSAQWNTKTISLIWIDFT